MKLSDFTKYAGRTRAILGNDFLNNVHMIFGMLTEVGELADAFKKYMAYGREIDWINVQEELGDLMWYVVNFCSINGFNLEKIFDATVEKLKVRYPEDYTDYKALNRNIDDERKSLEANLS